MEKQRHLELLGATIRSLREGLEITQDQMAFDAGFSRSYYSGVERGARNISAINLIKLANAMEIEVGELFPPMSLLRSK